MTLGLVTFVRLFLLAVGLVLLGMAFGAWKRRRRAPEGAAIALLMICSAVYCLGYAQEVAQTNLPAALFWIHLEYAGASWLSALWLWVALKHNGLRTPLWLLIPVPLITITAELTSAYHHLYDSAVLFVQRGPFWVVISEPGPLKWLHVAYLHATVLGGFWIYVSRLRGVPRLVRRQRLTLASSCMPPLLGYLAHLYGWSPWGLDFAPLMFGVSAVLAYYAVFQLQCLDLVPRAHTLVFNGMRDAVLVTDLRYRLMDFNPAARKLLPKLRSAKPGDDVAAILPETLDFALACETDTSRTIELPAADGENRFFDLRVSPLRVEKQQFGWVAMLANTTAQVKLVRKLQRHAETDELTGAANRRTFLSAVERESARSLRYGMPFSVLLLDLDHFKAINDGAGHPAGDAALRALARRIQSCLRATDLLSRYGGDEFAILLPEAGAQAAWDAAERIRNTAHGSVEYDGRNIDLSVSIGLATYDPLGSADWKQILKQADHALYAAKAAGRNRVMRWDRPDKRKRGQTNEHKGIVSDTKTSEGSIARTLE